MWARLSLAIVASAAIAVGCASTPKAAEPEQLYFALELKQAGKPVGSPKLLGETGRGLRAERRMPGALKPDYELTLLPLTDGDRYRVRLEVKVPGAEGSSELALLHGEERKLKLDDDLEVTLLLMQVDSPEFRALMELAERQDRRANSI